MEAMELVSISVCISSCTRSLWDHHCAHNFANCSAVTAAITVIGEGYERSEHLQWMFNNILGGPFNAKRGILYKCLFCRYVRYHRVVVTVPLGIHWIFDLCSLRGMWFWYHHHMHTTFRYSDWASKMEKRTRKSYNTYIQLNAQMLSFTGLLHLFGHWELLYKCQQNGVSVYDSLIKTAKKKKMESMCE